MYERTSCVSVSKTKAFVPLRACSRPPAHFQISLSRNGRRVSSQQLSWQPSIESASRSSNFWTHEETLRFTATLYRDKKLSALRFDDKVWHVTLEQVRFPSSHPTLPFPSFPMRVWRIR